MTLEGVPVVDLLVAVLAVVGEGVREVLRLDVILHVVLGLVRELSEQ